jgi:hypothetical protein
MASWILTLGLQNLRRQVDAAFPDRDKTSDGTIGDTAHQAETSGHNRDDTPGSKPEWNGDPDSTPEVRAWDMDSDLRAAPATAQQVVDHIRHLPGISAVLRYMIYNRKIYKASNDWYPEAYTGASAHTEHIHFSGAYSQAADNNTTFNYRLEEIPVALTTSDLAKIQAMINTAVSTLKASDVATADDLLSAKIGDVANPNRTVGDVLRDAAKLRGFLVGDPKDTANAAIPAAAPVALQTAAAKLAIAAAPAKPTA